VPAFAPGEAGGLIAGSPSVRRAARIRALPRLGFFICAVALAACAPGDPHARARAADSRYGTSAFSWLVEHDPATVVAWRVPAAEVSAVIPDARVVPALGDSPCAQARVSHAALLLIARRSARVLRDRADDCGFALFRDDGALVIAPLPR
jgi:hypothetical protein